MLRRISAGLAVAATLLGGLHLGMTGVVYGRLSLEALWFGGSGLALVLAGLLNLAALRAAADGGSA